MEMRTPRNNCCDFVLYLFDIKRCRSTRHARVVCAFMFVIVVFVMMPSYGSGATCFDATTLVSCCLARTNELFRKSVQDVCASIIALVCLNVFASVSLRLQMRLYACVVAHFVLNRCRRSLVVWCPYMSS